MKRNKKDNLIYHYCSLETFFAIITNKCIRLSDLNKTNDYMEKRWITTLIEGELISALKEWEIEINLNEDYWYSDNAKSHMKYYKNEMESVLYHEKPVLISCFSEEKDILSQWRAYGNDGMGVSIGFDYKLLKLLEKGENKIWVEKVLYKENQQKALLDSCINNTLCYMEKYFNNDEFKVTKDYNNYFRDNFDIFCEVLPDYLEQVSCYIKNPAFSEEKEVRIIYDPSLYNPLDILPTDNEKNMFFNSIKEVGGYSISPIKFNIRNNKIVTYVDLDFSDLVKKNIIKEIVIGPRSQVKENDVYYLLMANGYSFQDISVGKSSATYR
ncbi:MAG: DUF2971 domain-containing protein [Clostridium paraputrificum]